MVRGQQIEREILDKIEKLKSDGGRVGAWTIDASDSQNRQHQKGGMGTIIRAHRMTMRGERQDGAIKFQIPKSLPDGTLLFEEKAQTDIRFEHENNILEYLNQRTQNPCILRALDKGADLWSLPCGIDIYIPFFVTEFIGGGNLYFAIRPDRNPIDQGHANPGVISNQVLKGQAWLNLAYDLCLGLVDMHNNRVIHQDLKPENVMQHNGRYVIVDFGLASYINYPDPGDAPGGTRGWMPPEQLYRIWGPKDQEQHTFSANDTYVDVYSTGALLAFAASGTPPWEPVMLSNASENRIQYFFDQMMTQSPYLANLNASQRKLILAMMHPNFHFRPSAQECLDRIARMMSGSNSRKREYAKRVGASTGALPRLPSAKQYAAQNQARALAHRKVSVPVKQSTDWSDVQIEFIKLIESIKEYWSPLINWVKLQYKSYKTNRELRIANKNVLVPQKVAAIDVADNGDEFAFDSDESGNPVFPATWLDIQTRFYELMEQIGRNRFVIEIESSSVSGIFIQGYFESDGSLTVECAADLSVRPRITKQQRDNLLALGWESPSRQIPNFIQFLDVASSNAEQVSELFMKTLRDGYLVPVGEIEIS